MRSSCKLFLGCAFCVGANCTVGGTQRCDGKRKRGLQEAFEAMLAEELEHHVLDFDQAAADRAGKISATLHGLGRPVEIRDVQIAGIVTVRHAVLATRNLKHFRDTGVSLVDPWGEL